MKVVRLLLEKGADPNVEGRNGLTPLHVATHYNHVNVALLLLEKDADPCIAAKVRTCDFDQIQFSELKIREEALLDFDD